MADVGILWPICHVTHQNSGWDHKHLQHNLFHDKKLDPPRPGLKASNEACCIAHHWNTDCSKSQVPVYWRWAKLHSSGSLDHHHLTVRSRQLEREEFSNDGKKNINNKRTWSRKHELHVCHQCAFRCVIVDPLIYVIVYPFICMGVTQSSFFLVLNVNLHEWEIIQYDWGVL